VRSPAAVCRRMRRYRPSPIATMMLQEVRVMLRSMRAAHRRRLLPRLEAFERVIVSWETTPPSIRLRNCTMTHVAALKREALEMVGVPSTCTTSVEGLRPHAGG
jgi:hypothetical protein